MKESWVQTAGNDCQWAIDLVGSKKRKEDEDEPHKDEDEAHEKEGVDEAHLKVDEDETHWEE